MAESSAGELPAEQLADASSNAVTPIAGPSRPARRPAKAVPTQDDILESLRLRTTRIKAGDHVLLRLPSETVKAVVASYEGCVFCMLGSIRSFAGLLVLGSMGVSRRGA